MSNKQINARHSVSSAVKFMSFWVGTLFLTISECSEGSPVESSNPFVGTFVFPHGGIILDAPTRNFSQDPGFKSDTSELAKRLHEAMKAAASSVIKLKPDLIILSTPHGFSLDEHYLIASAPEMGGDAGWFWSNFKARFDIAKAESASLYLSLQKKGLPVEFMSFGVGSSRLPLMWGEVIPWWFIQQAASQSGFQLPPVIYIGQPPKTNVSELLSLGSAIVQFARTDLSSRRIGVVISGDLSHRHSSDPQAPYPFDPSSSVFDGAIKDWAMVDRTFATENKSDQALLVKAKDVADAAGSCGYTGILMLHGMLRELVKCGFEFKNKFYEYAAPTYFGMTVTSWVPKVQ